MNSSRRSVRRQGWGSRRTAEIVLSHFCQLRAEVGHPGTVASPRSPGPQSPVPSPRLSPNYGDMGGAAGRQRRSCSPTSANFGQKWGTRGLAAGFIAVAVAVDVLLVEELRGDGFRPHGVLPENDVQGADGGAVLVGEVHFGGLLRTDGFGCVGGVDEAVVAVAVIGVVGGLVARAGEFGGDERGESVVVVHGRGAEEGEDGVDGADGGVEVVVDNGR